MIGVGRPLRFLALLLGGWVAMRLVVLWPTAEEIGQLAMSPGEAITPVVPVEVTPPARFPAVRFTASDLSAPIRSSRRAALAAMPYGDAFPLAPADAQTVAISVPMQSSPGSPIGNQPTGNSRWSASAWLIARGTGNAALAPGSILGGSQTGVRIAWRPIADMPVALFGRVSRPLRTAGAEAAIGVEAQPVEDLPVRVALEQRFALERGAAAGTAASVIGGVSDVALPGGFKLDGYGQAGVIGLRRREAFVDGSASILRPVISFDDTDILLGAGIWGAAQPGLSRLDIGPRAELRLPVASQRVRLGLEWRERVVGNARPGSGPTLTIGTDF